MGKEKILKVIKKGARNKVILGVILGIISAFMTLVLIAAAEDDGGVWVGVVIFAALLVGCIVLTVFGVKELKDPMRASAIKKNPELLHMADELYANKTFEDDFIVLSDRIIANSKNPLEMAYTDEIFLIYVYTHKTNGITDQKQLKLENARGTIGVNIMLKKDNEVDALVQRVCENCKHARVGYTPEGLDYLKQMRELWKRDQASKHTTVNGQII